MKTFTWWASVIILIALVILGLCATSCTKDKTSMACGQVFEVKDVLTLDKKLTLAVDTVWRSVTVVCGQQFQNYVSEEQSGYDKRFTSYCPEGITLYYYRLRMITF